MKQRANGRFWKEDNVWETKVDVDGTKLYYCFQKGELLFFTDDERVTDYHWTKYGQGYAETRIDCKNVIAHRFIAHPEPWEVVDHINRNKKDNRRCNLRNTTQTINSLNKASMSPGGVNGVHFRKDIKKWEARITLRGNHIALGCYETKFEAAIARKSAERVVQFYEGVKGEIVG